MQDKKQIGQKIWDLFLKNYSYSKIAKELGVTKSVVSNVINYTLPSATWCNENVKELKEKHQKEIELLKKECLKFAKGEKVKTRKIATKNATIIVFLITLTFLGIDNFYLDFFLKIFKKTILAIGGIFVSAFLIAGIFYILFNYFIKIYDEI